MLDPGTRHLSCLFHAYFCQPEFPISVCGSLTVFLAVSRYSKTWGLPREARDRWQSTWPSLPVQFAAFMLLRNHAGVPETSQSGCHGEATRIASGEGPAKDVW
jgi:hypothetical protein